MRELTSSESEALCSLNAPYPDGTHDFFWKSGRSDPDARRCYRLGKSVLEDCRSKLISGELIATGETNNSVRQVIPAAWWSSLYPMFATGMARGRTRLFKNVEVRRNELTQAEVKLDECIAWLRQRQLEGVTAKKVLRHQSPAPPRNGVAANSASSDQWDRLGFRMFSTYSPDIFGPCYL